MPDAPAAEPEAPLLTAADISFSYPGDSKPTVGKTSLELQRGRVVGLFGVNACGKTTLARCLCDRLQPATGAVARSSAATASSGGSASAATGGGSGRGGAYLTVAAVFCVVGAGGAALWPELPRQQQRQAMQVLAELGEAAGLSKLPPAGIAAFVALSALLFLSELMLLLSRCIGDSGSGGSAGAGATPPPGISFITSEDYPANQLPQDATLEATLTALLPTSKFPDAESRREEAIRLMETGNFQRYNQTTVRLPPASCSLIHRQAFVCLALQRQLFLRAASS